jgi:hypothetical protein
MGYSLHVNHKQVSTDSSPDRNLQCEYVAELRSRFQSPHLPIINAIPRSANRSATSEIQDAVGNAGRAPL